MVRASDSRRLVVGDRTGTLEAAPRDVRAGLLRLDLRARRASRAARGLRAPAAPARDEYDPRPTSVDGPRIPRGPDGGRPARADRDGPVAPPARAAGSRVRARAPRPGRAFREAPAAKRFHQAYRHGLLEHSLTVAQACPAISATFGGVDRDVAVTGALLHDIGKLDAYTADPLAIEMTDLGKLQGEIALGYYRIRRADRGPPRLPGRTGRRRAAHHPQPPRPARARLAGRARARARRRSCT